eukprot:TRINITY_DN29841_c0_g1_i1.p1 TRINITY_DN29841_c0_g1~~TRINITY_DN29841_c0_g1_i1.p1  ORF type:complete len:745 (+),score=156.76 TRINITY_DN29841_c0_g1_i1:199-2235(+)
MAKCLQRSPMFDAKAVTSEVTMLAFETARPCPSQDRIGWQPDSVTTPRRAAIGSTMRLKFATQPLKVSSAEVDDLSDAASTTAAGSLTGRSSGVESTEGGLGGACSQAVSTSRPLSAASIRNRERVGRYLEIFMAPQRKRQEAEHRAQELNLEALGAVAAAKAAQAASQHAEEEASVARRRLAEALAAQEAGPRLPGSPSERSVTPSNKSADSRSQAKRAAVRVASQAVPGRKSIAPNAKAAGRNSLAANTGRKSMSSPPARKSMVSPKRKTLACLEPTAISAAVELSAEELEAANKLAADMDAARKAYAPLSASADRFSKAARKDAKRGDAASEQALKAARAKLLQEALLPSDENPLVDRAERAKLWRQQPLDPYDGLLEVEVEVVVLPPEIRCSKSVKEATASSSTRSTSKATTESSDTSSSSQEKQDGSSRRQSDAEFPGCEHLSALIGGLGAETALGPPGGGSEDHVESPEVGSPSEAKARKGNAATRRQKLGEAGFGTAGEGMPRSAQGLPTSESMYLFAASLPPPPPPSLFGRQRIHLKPRLAIDSSLGRYRDEPQRPWVTKERPCSAPVRRKKLPPQQGADNPEPARVAGARHEVADLLGLVDLEPATKHDMSDSGAVPAGGATGKQPPISVTRNTEKRRPKSASLGRLGFDKKTSPSALHTRPIRAMIKN